MKNSILKTEDIQKYYGNKGHITKAINGISFEVEEGEFVGIMGASGSGKTTLLKREVLSYTYQMTSMNNNDRGTIIVPDELTAKLAKERVTPCVQGFYKEGTDTQEANRLLALLVKDLETTPFGWTSKTFMNTMYYSVIALPTFLFLYIGLIFMLICVALLSVQQLTAVSENSKRYLLLKRQGVTDKMLRGTIRKQVGVYFGAPLMLAVVYASIALPAVRLKVSSFMSMEIGAHLLVTMVLMLLVYGGYYVMTFATCEKMTVGRSLE